MTYFEEWKDVEGFEGMYRISSFGRVMNLPRKVGKGKVGWQTAVSIAKQRKPIYNKKPHLEQYCLVNFSVKWKKSIKKPHRLVAQAFIPNPEKKKQVNHIDGIKYHNGVWNLEWNTSFENQRHAFDTGLNRRVKSDTTPTAIKFKKIDERSLQRRIEIVRVRKFYGENRKKITIKEMGGILNMPPRNIARIIKGYTFNKYNMTKLLHIGLSASQKPQNGLEKAFRKYFDYEDINTAYPNLNEAILAMLKSFKPDVAFMQIQREDVINVETVLELKRIGCFVVNWTGDVRFPIPEWYYEIGGYIDYTLFTNYTDVHTMRERGYRSDFLELGIDREIYKPKGDITPTKDVVFMANSYGHLKFPLSVARIEMVNFLKKVMHEKFALYGTGWGQGITNLADGNLMHSQYVEAAHYRGCKIGINFSHFDADRYSSDRLTRIMGSGAFCLCKRFTNCGQRFKDGEHLRYFDTLEELENLINYYLDPANESERKTIAQQGCELIHEKYTFENLALNLKGMYEASLKPKEKLKVVAYVILHYGKQFLKEAIQAVAPFVDDIFIFYTDKPSHGHGTEATCPDSEEELMKMAYDASIKCHWIKGIWGQEGEHRNEIYKFAPDADIIVNFDADEILNTEDLPKSIEFVANGDKRNYGVNGYINFWHTMDWEVKDFYRPIRFINTKNQWGTQGEVMQRIYHFGYCQDLETIRYKLSCHGHSDEIPSNWLEEKYLAWTPENRVQQLHPASSQVWGDAFPFKKKSLPDYVKAHPIYSKTI